MNNLNEMNNVGCVIDPGNRGVERHQVIRAVRALTPARALTDSEARSVAERQAGRLRALLDLTDPIVDLEPIAGLPRIEVRTVPGLPVSGFSEWSRSRWLIAINGDDHWTRRRFTLAHEFKHVLDHPFIGLLYPGADRQPDQAQAERICDFFGGCLLMPRADLKRLWGTGHQRVEDLAAHFGVSRAAMGLRLHQLGLTSGRDRCGLPGRYQRTGSRSIIGSEMPSGLVGHSLAAMTGHGDVVVGNECVSVDGSERTMVEGQRSDFGNHDGDSNGGMHVVEELLVGASFGPFVAPGSGLWV